MTIRLGSKVRDSFTNFEGIAEIRSEYLYGETLMKVQPVAQGGKLDDGVWFQEKRLEAAE